MSPQSINNLGIVIHMDATIFRTAWEKLYGGSQWQQKCQRFIWPIHDPASYTETMNAYLNAKHRIMLNELHGIRGFPYFTPLLRYDQVEADYHRQLLFGTIGNAFLPVIEHIQDAMQSLARSLSSMAQAQAAFQSLAQSIDQRGSSSLGRNIDDQTRDTIIAMVVDPDWNPPEEGHYA